MAKSSHSRVRLLAGIALVFAAGACGSAQVPHQQQQLSASQAAIRAAKEVGAERDPKAALHLRLAREQFAHAQTLIEAGEEERASVVLRRADADAELAIALARQSVARLEANKALDQIRAMSAPGSGR